MTLKTRKRSDPSIITATTQAVATEMMTSIEVNRRQRYNQKGRESKYRKIKYRKI
jgi:hypothetical protein